MIESETENDISSSARKKKRMVIEKNSRCCPFPVTNFLQDVEIQKSKWREIIHNNASVVIDDTVMQSRMHQSPLNKTAPNL